MKLDNFSKFEENSKNLTIELQNMADYTFDGINFENIEKIGDFPPIINLKNARKQNKRKEYDDCISLI